MTGARHVVSFLSRIWRCVFMRPDDATKYPGVPRAYELARDSYDLMMRRYEFAQVRVEAIAGVAVTIGVAVPAIVAQAEMTRADFTDLRLYGAMFALAGILALLIAAKAFGGFVLISPKELYGSWLHLAEAEFQTEYVYWAGEHFERNARAIWWKSVFGSAIALLLVPETALLVWWVLAA